MTAISWENHWIGASKTNGETGLLPPFVRKMAQVVIFELAQAKSLGGRARNPIIGRDQRESVR
jgi:hypothetical protein